MTTPFSKADFHITEKVALFFNAFVLTFGKFYCFRPNVCRFQYKTSIRVWEHFEVPYYKTYPVWKKDCGAKGAWCKVDEQR